MAGGRTTAAYELKGWYELKRLDKRGKHSHAVYVLRKQEGIPKFSPFYPFGNKKRRKDTSGGGSTFLKLILHFGATPVTKVRP